MYRFAFGIAVGLSLMLAVEGQAGSSPLGKYLTNVELIQLAVKAALHEGLEEMPQVGWGKIAVRSLEKSEIDWLVEAEILGVLARGETGVRLYEGPPPDRKKKRGKKSIGAPAAAVFDEPPEFASGAPIAYPEEVCEKGLGGNVTIRLIINEMGSVANTVIERSSDPLLEGAVVSGVESWRFEPARKDGEPTIGPVFYRFEFPVLDDGDCASFLAKGEHLEKFDPDESSTTAVASPQPPAPKDVPVLAYRVSELEFLYPDAGRRLWVGPKKVERFGRTRIELRLEKEGDVIWASSAEHYVSDKVPAGTLPALEGSTYEFSKPPMPEGSGKLVEPFVIAGVVGGMIALFYTNQSAD